MAKTYTSVGVTKSTLKPSVIPNQSAPTPGIYSPAHQAALRNTDAAVRGNMTGPTGTDAEATASAEGRSADTSPVATR